LPDTRAERMIGVVDRPSRDGAWPLVAFVLAAFVGGAIGGALALQDLWLLPAHPTTASAPLFIVGAAFAAGVVMSWLLVTLAISRVGRGRFRCPRCGTAGDRSAHSCSACDLSFV
jgi:hypothetical protein